MLVRTTEDGGLFLAQIEVRHGEAITRRNVSDPTCATATTALAVIAALTVEREPVTIVHTVPEPPPPLPPPLAPSPWHLRVGGSFVMTSLLRPSVSVGALGYAELDHDGSRFFAWRFRAGFEYATGFEVEVATASTLLRSYAGRVEIGGPRVELSHALELNLGAVGVFGGLVGDGRGASLVESHTSARADLGAIARLRMSVWRLAFEVGLGALVPMYHTRFLFQPGPSVAYESPPLGVLGDVGASIWAL